MVICVVFLRDVARQKLFKSTNVSWSYSRNNTGTVFLRHSVLAAESVGVGSIYFLSCDICHHTSNRYTAKLGGHPREQKYW